MLKEEAYRKEQGTFTISLQEKSVFAASEKTPMATVTTTPPASTSGPTPAAGRPAPFRLNVAQYDAMIEAGILTEDHKVELVGGVLLPAKTTASGRVTRRASSDPACFSHSGQGLARLSHDIG